MVCIASNASVGVNLVLGAVGICSRNFRYAFSYILCGAPEQPLQEVPLKSVLASLGALGAPGGGTGGCGVAPFARAIDSNRA